MNEHDDFHCHLLAEFLVVFANPVRLRLFCGLREHPMTVTQLAEYAGITLPNASQHLRLMRDKGAVASKKRGQHVFYRVADQRFVEAAELMRDALIDALERTVASIHAKPSESPSEDVHAKTG